MVYVVNQTFFGIDNEWYVLGMNYNLAHWLIYQIPILYLIYQSIDTNWLIINDNQLIYQLIGWLTMVILRVINHIPASLTSIGRCLPSIISHQTLWIKHHHVLSMGLSWIVHECPYLVLVFWRWNLVTLFKICYPWSTQSMLGHSLEN